LVFSEEYTNMIEPRAFDRADLPRTQLFVYKSPFDLRLHITHDTNAHCIINKWVMWSCLNVPRKGTKDVSKHSRSPTIYW